MEESKNLFANYNKPYWDKGNWNFSYLRNKLNNKLNADLMSRLYGNYFVVAIQFGGDNHRYEFEMLNYSVSLEKGR